MWEKEVNAIDELLYADDCQKLEQEFGCSFKTVKRALKEGIYYKFREDNSNKLSKMKVPMLRIVDNEYCWICPKWMGATWMNVKLKDYKKTWWLKEDKSE